MRTKHGGLAALAGLLGLLGLIAALLVAVLVSPGQNLTEADEFADAVVATLETSEGQQAITDEVTTQIVSASGLPPGVVEPAAAAGVEAAFDNQAAVDALTVSAEQLHGQVVAEDPSDTLTVDLSPLREPVVNGISQVNPAAAQSVPEDLGSVEIASGEGVEAAGSVAWWAGRPGLLAGLLIGAVAALGLAILLSWDRVRAARAVGVGLLFVAAVPVVIALIAQPVAEAAAEGTGTEDVAGEFAKEIASLQPIVPVLIGGVGLALIAVSMARNRW
jgi:hypothetical protein